MDIYSLIDECKVISFDIFDTLIYRIYDKPSDLFSHLEYVSGKKGFAAARIEAELQTRNIATTNGKSEIHLDDIYKNIDREYKDLKEKEVELELFACKKNNRIENIYQYALSKNKIIIITSDMYLPKEIIEMILKNNGIDKFDRLFLSSDFGVTKAEGGLYEIVKDYYKGDVNDILHIGDHLYTDIKIAEQHGLKTFYYDELVHTNADIRMPEFFETLNHYNEIGLSILKKLVKQRYIGEEKDFWKECGYSYFGALTISYVRWIKEQIDRLGINKVYFMLRDGYNIKHVFERLYPEIECHEIYGSRRMFLFAGMEKYNDVRLHISGIHTAGLTYDAFWKRLYIEDEELEKEYRREFPNGNYFITKPEELKELDMFMIKHEAELIKIGNIERENVIAYFESIGLFDGKNAIVDLGWKASMLKGIGRLCRLENKKKDIIGFYTGTHECDTEGEEIYSYSIEFGKCKKGYDICNVLKGGSFAVNLLELVYSAPHPSIVKILRDRNEFVPIYQHVSPEEQKRIDICGDILDGIEQFCEDFCEIDNSYKVETNLNFALAPLDYIANHLSIYDEKKINEVCYLPGVGDDSTSFPISKHGVMTFGVINPWPGDMSAENEVIARLKQTAADLGAKCIALDNFGCVLDNNMNKTNTYLDGTELDFVITTHYETPKLLDTFYYHAVWNPPEIPLNLDYYYTAVTNNYLMNDDYLIYDNGGMTDHLKCILKNRERNITEASMLVASCPKSFMLEPDLSDPIMFYCGMNWETVVHNTSRHEGLFKLLDSTGKVRFFGPEVNKAWGGIRPWAGYKSYKGQIPFDGYSLINEVHRCGVCLVLSSDIHRRVGAVTNRAYEALTAGAVMISDDNEFMKKWFGDCALFINYNKNNPKDTFEQIMEKYNWILSHREEALEMARRAQNVFVTSLSMDIQLYNMLNNHARRFDVIKKDMFAECEEEKVLVSYVLNTLNIEDAKTKLKSILSNTKRQIYRNIVVGIACDNRLYPLLRKEYEGQVSNLSFVPIEIFDNKLSQKLTNGECLRIVWDRFEADYIMIASADEIWFYDHVSTLIRACTDKSAVAAYSGRFAKSPDNPIRTVERFNLITNKTVYYGQYPDFIPKAGQLIFSKRIVDEMDRCFYSSLDGYEHYAILADAFLKKGQAIAFSKRMTFGYVTSQGDNKFNILPIEYQIRLVRDYLSDEHENGIIGNNATGKGSLNVTEVRRIIATMSLKYWIKFRLYRARLRLRHRKPEKTQQLEQKYNDILHKFMTTD